MNEIAMNQTPSFSFPPDINLNQAPLVEAWLSIQWKLATNELGFVTDPDFPYAIGRFYDNIKNEFPYRTPLDISQMPLQVLSHRVLYQFKQSEQNSNLLQLGPGVASINYVDNYGWHSFKKDIFYLKDNLFKSYDEKLQISLLSLRYRNAIPFSYTKNNLLNFLNNNLNTGIQLPQHIPGNANKGNLPSGFSLVTSFNLTYPPSVGILRIASGIKKNEEEQVNEEEHLIIEFEVLSEGDLIPDIQDTESFDNWLGSAHSVIHDWFFSMIDGSLLEQYRGR